MAEVTLPGRRKGFRRCRFGPQLNRQGRCWGTLMRHFLLPSPILTLAFGVGTAAAMRVLIATASGSYRLIAGLWRTSPRAIAVAAITVAADQHGDAAAGAQVASSGEFHWQSGPMGSRRRRALREILCRQRRPSGLRGATSGLAWRLGPVSRQRFHRPVDFLPHRRRRRYLTPAALRLPDNDCSAIRPPEALRAANRKTGIFMPDMQKPKSPHRFATSSRERQISTLTGHR